MFKIAVIGSKNFCDGFRLAGVQEVYEARNEEEAKKTYDQLNPEDIGLVIIESGLEQSIPRKIEPIVLVLAKNFEENEKVMKVVESRSKATIGGLLEWKEKL